MNRRKLCFLSIINSLCAHVFCFLLLSKPYQQFFCSSLAHLPFSVAFVRLFIFAIHFDFVVLDDGKNIMFWLAAAYAHLPCYIHGNFGIVERTFLLTPPCLSSPLNDIKWTRYRKLRQQPYDKLMLKWWSLVKTNCHKSHESSINMMTTNKKRRIGRECSTASIIRGLSYERNHFYQIRACRHEYFRKL